MKIELHCLAGLIVCAMAPAAMAADLPLKAPASVAPVAYVYDWSGIYVGAHLGYNFSNNQQNVVTSDPKGSLIDPSGLSQIVLFPRQLDGRRNGIIGGGQIGINYQWQNTVIGLEADFSGLQSRASSNAQFAFYDATKAPFPNYTSANYANVKQDWLGTLRGRVGYAFDNVLLYGTGGLAVGRVTSSSSFSIINTGNPPPDFLSGNQTTTRVGFAVGAGAEYGITKNMSVSLEYLYYDLGTVRYSTLPDAFTKNDIPGVYQTVNYKVNGNIVNAGLNFRF